MPEGIRPFVIRREDTHSVVPIFVISLFVQRHFVRGLTMGAVKT